MTLLHADKIKIELDSEKWRLYAENDKRNKSPLFSYIRGDAIIRYDANFGKKIGFPGDRLSTEYIRSVLVGYHEKSHRWILGLHLSEFADDKPIFKAIVRWPEADNQKNIQEVRQAARSLALLLTCPLKIFGEKKLPVAGAGPNRSGVTGPLTPHVRQRIDRDVIEVEVRKIELPIQVESFTLKKGRNGLVLQQGKFSDKDVETPTFNLCEINQQDQKVKLIPSTGLLGAFMRSSNKEIPFDRIHNVEFRHIKEQIAIMFKAKGQLAEEKLSYRHLWGVYLTLSDLSLLLAQTTFTQSSELLQTHITARAGTKFDTNSLEGVKYFQEHLEEQEKLDTQQYAVEHAAYMIAYTINKHLVKTEVEIE